jgi:hypothetical protein
VSFKKTFLQSFRINIDLSQPMPRQGDRRRPREGEVQKLGRFCCAQGRAVERRGGPSRIWSASDQKSRQHAERQEALMRMFALIGVLFVLTGSAFAQSPSCKAQAGEKKLAGAVLNQLHEKC